MIHKSDRILVLLPAQEVTYHPLIEVFYYVPQNEGSIGDDYKHENIEIELNFSPFFKSHPFLQDNEKYQHFYCFAYH